MNDQLKPDWDPKSEEVVRDQRAAYDEMRRRCPVAYSEFMKWSLFKHEDVVRVALDHETFSNAVSQHLSVPNGMDPPEHTEYRRIIEPYFAQERMDAFEPVCGEIASDLVRTAMAASEVELMSEVAFPFAARVQCAFLGWPSGLHEPLLDWTGQQYEATLTEDRPALSRLAREFEHLIDDLLETRRQANAGPDEDITTALLHENVWGRSLSNEEIASILRNWTVGEIGTISAAVGILSHFLVTNPELQRDLRGNPTLLPAAIDEILRLHGPLVSNRRVAICPVEIGGRKIDAGQQISLNWMSANRDELVFEDPEMFRLDRDPSKNLLYGAGIHVCPGAPLARMELRIFIEEFFQRSSQIQLVAKQLPTNAIYPASGFASLPLKID